MGKFMRKLLPLTLVIAMVFALGITASAAEETTLTIIHTNDMHGHPEAVAYAKGLADELKANGENVLLIDAGDALNSTAFSSYEDATNMVTIMNMADYDLATIGNHEGFMSVDAYRAAYDLAEYPVVAANVGDEYREAGGLKDYEIMEIAGTKIAFIGLTVGNHTSLDGDAAIACAETAKTAAEAEGATAFIGVFHLGITDPSEALRSTHIANACPWFSLIIDAHCHTPYAETVNGVYMVETGEYSNNLGVVKMNLSDGKISNITSERIAIIGNEEACGITPNAEITAYVDQKNEELAYLQEIVYNFPVELEGDRTVVRAKEAVIGNLMADALLAANEADVSMFPGVFIRANVAPGEMTRETYMGLFLKPSTEVYVVEISGATLLEQIEIALKGLPEVSPDFKQIGGMRISYDETKPVGSRIVSVTTNRDGAAIDPNRSYKLACTDMEMTSLYGENWLEQNLTNYVAAEKSANTAFLEYLNAGKGVWELDGRIAAAAPVVPAEPATPAEPTGNTYTVVSGDNLWKISQKHYGTGTRWGEIYEANKATVKNPNLIYVGQELNIP